MQHDTARIAGAAIPLRLGNGDFLCANHWLRERKSRDGSDLAREAKMRQQVRAVRQHVHDESRVADTDRLQELRAGRNVRVEFEDAGVFLAEPEFARGAEHSVGRLSADLSLLDLE